MQNNHQELNPAQAEVASYLRGPLLIVAGAGAGKTKTIAHRILNLIQSGIPAHQILAITFTNKAAKEMRDRVLHLIQSESAKLSTPFVSTFHSLGVYIIKEQAYRLGLTRYFTIYDQDDSLSAIKRALKSEGLDPKQYEPKRLQNAISREKNNLVTHDLYSEQHLGEYWGDIVAKVWKAYEKILEKDKALDFDDLIVKTVWLFEKFPEVQKYYANKWHYIHIDEYQDTNVAQYALSHLLAKSHRNICVVGDTDQAIYGWRGADYQNILKFESEYPDAKVVLLEQNYRSTQTILEAANSIISKNTLRKEKNLFTANAKGEQVTIYQAGDGPREAHWVAKKCEELIRGRGESSGKSGGLSSATTGINPNNIAILYRMNFLSRLFEEAFLTRGVPYHLLGTAFYSRKEVKDTLAYIRLALNSEDTASLLRIINVPARGIGDVTAEKIVVGKEDELPASMRDKLSSFRSILADIKAKCLSETPSNAVRYAIKRSGIEAMYADGKEESEERLENVRELATLATRYDNLTPGPSPKERGELNDAPSLSGRGMGGEVTAGIEKFLEDTALLSDQDSLMNKKEGVRMMTVHAAKGLEFDYVFIVGLEGDIFPHRRMNDDASIEQEEEERRLFYVALTRARKKVFLTHCLIRTIFGSQKIQSPSEFIGDIPEDLAITEGAENGYAEPFSLPRRQAGSNSDGEVVIEWDIFKRR
ncbi:MAG: UvrD-helicase domain-containing protein [Candidatus Paceibacterota bacterium]|jgi:DNA helicase-2/ATP-dependent DNA helicase PcrA